jgi:hypothetical protein
MAPLETAIGVVVHDLRMTELRYADAMNKATQQALNVQLEKNCFRRKSSYSGLKHQLFSGI